MTSRVEELQRMCDNINENGGLDSGEWHTALLAQIAQNLAVIADVMMADRKTEPNSSEKPNNCETCRHNKLEWYSEVCDGCSKAHSNYEPQTDLLVKTPRKSRESHEKNCETCRDKDAYDEWQGNCDECENGSMYTPQTDCGDFADRLAYERGVKHAWEVAQKVFNSTVTFYEAEDVAKQIDKDINVPNKSEVTNGR